MMDTGLRIQDLSQVKVSDQDLDTGPILISGRKIKIPPRALLELQDYRQYRPRPSLPPSERDASWKSL
jgi:hypothetical protein